jgi:hypothetical protein
MGRLNGKGKRYNNHLEAIELVLEANRELSEKELVESEISGIEIIRKELAIAR